MPDIPQLILDLSAFNPEDLPQLIKARIAEELEDELADWPSLLDAFSDRAFPGSEDLFEMMLSNIIAHDTEEIDQQYILDEINIMLDTEYTDLEDAIKELNNDI